MIKEYVISDKNDGDLSEFEDLAEVHKIRGRFLHLMSILEKIMKDYCNESNSKKMYGELKEIFIRRLTENNLNNIDGFYEFVKALHEINPERSKWAHGLVYYKKGFDEKPNNFILLGSSNESIRHTYFEKLNVAFDVIISWLKKNNLWEINDYQINES